MSTRLVVLLFIIFRLVDLSFSYIAPFFIPYLGFFPYTEMFKHTFLPPFIYSFANFDGLHYVRTATMGYSQYAQAFFPLYPLLIRYSRVLLGNDAFLTGLVISYLFFMIGLLLLNKYLQSLRYSSSQIFWVIIFLNVFPSSFFFGALYNTSLFFCFVIASLYFSRKKQFVFAGLCAILASVTRLEGIFLVIVFIIPLFFSKKKYQLYPRILFVIFSPIAGLISFMAYLWKTTGDPLFFIHSQPAFGANRSSSIILLPQVLYRYIKIFITANHDFRYFVSVLEFSIFMIVLGILLVDLFYIYNHRKQKNFVDELGLNLFSLCNLLLPTLTGTLSSIPRYSLMALSVFIVLAKIQNTFVKVCVAVLLFVIHAVMLMFFIQGYFVS